MRVHTKLYLSRQHLSNFTNVNKDFFNFFILILNSMLIPCWNLQRTKDIIKGSNGWIDDLKSPEVLNQNLESESETIAHVVYIFWKLGFKPQPGGASEIFLLYVGSQVRFLNYAWEAFSDFFSWTVVVLYVNFFSNFFFGVVNIYVHFIAFSFHIHLSTLNFNNLALLCL